MGVTLLYIYFMLSVRNIFDFIVVWHLFMKYADEILENCDIFHCALRVVVGIVLNNNCQKKRKCVNILHDSRDEICVCSIKKSNVIFS